MLFRTRASCLLLVPKYLLRPTPHHSHSVCLCRPCEGVWSSVWALSAGGKVLARLHTPVRMRAAVGSLCEWLRHNRQERLNRAVGAVHASPGTRMACPTPRMLARRTQHHPLSAANEQINHGKQNTGPQSIVLPGFRASEHRPTPSMVVP